MTWVDSHCHLSLPPLAAAAGEVLDRARLAGVAAVVAPAFHRECWNRLAEFRSRRGVAVAFGQHPWAAGEAFDGENLARELREGAAAVGEIGLDFAAPGVPARETQVVLCAAQLELAARLDLPVILHCRGAFAELRRLLAERRPRLRGVIHGFSRGPELAAAFLRLGFHLGLGAALTWPKAAAVRRTARALPLERILIETDAPTQAVAGEPAAAVEPRHAAVVGQELARLRGIPMAELAEATTANARDLFRLP